MPSDVIHEVYRQFRIAQDKYTYFLLAAVGGGIALALDQTHDAALSWSQVPLGGAALSWGLSFFFGCRHLAYITSSLYANFELLKVESGQHPDVRSDPQMMAIASEGIRQALASNSERVGRYGRIQVRFLICGGVLYIVWHVFEMWLRSVT